MDIRGWEAKIIAWRGEEVKIKDIITRSGRSIIERILKSAKDLPHKKVPDHKRPTGRKRVTSTMLWNLSNYSKWSNIYISTIHQLFESYDNYEFE